MLHEGGSGQASRLLKKESPVSDVRVDRPVGRLREGEGESPVRDVRVDRPMGRLREGEGRDMRAGGWKGGKRKRKYRV